MDYRDDARGCKRMKQASVQMSATNRKILAEFAATLRGRQEGGFLYVGSIKELYKRDQLPIPKGLNFRRERRVGFEIAIYVQVHQITPYTDDNYTNVVHPTAEE